MFYTSTVKSTTKALARDAEGAASVTEAIPPATLESFVNGGGFYPGFQFKRGWWEGPGEREGIYSTFASRIQVGDCPKAGMALRHEVLLPDLASSEYLDWEVLVRRFDETLPSFCHDAYAAVKIDLPPDQAPHVGFETVRSYAHEYFVRGKDLPVVLALHVPYMAGSKNRPHTHILIPARQLGAHGFGLACRDLCSDQGHLASFEAWKAFQRERNDV
jgi:hypothetical protein